MDHSRQREDFLQHVRQAVQRGRRFRVSLREDIPAKIAYVGAGQDLVESLAQELEAVGARPHRVSSPREGRDVVRDLLAGFQVRSALCWEHPVLERCGIHELLRELGVRVLGARVAGMEQGGALGLRFAQPQSPGRGELFAADVGISSVDWAVAETGTLALSCAAGRAASASLLPPVHIVIVEEPQIVPDLFDLFRHVEQAGLPSNLTLITGPSKTGDIELKLTTGVHGPGEVHVVIVSGHACDV